MAKGTRGGKRTAGLSSKSRNIENLADEYMKDDSNMNIDWTKSDYDKDLERAKLYAQYQDGTADKNNFFYRTFGEFTPVDKPDREPDHVSRDRNGKISSQYWYTQDGVIRRSNHWGSGVASCDWYLKTNKMKKDGLTVTNNKKCGYIKWTDLLHKPQVINIDNKKYLSTFKNTTGKEAVKINGNSYHFNVYTFEWVKY